MENQRQAHHQILRIVLVRTVIKPLLILVGCCPLLGPLRPSQGGDLSQQVARLFETRCVSCHNDEDRAGGLAMQGPADWLAGGDSGPAVVPGQVDASLLYEMIAGDEPYMPQDGRPLSADDQQRILHWIQDGATWSVERRLEDRSLADLQWWSLEPLVRPTPPKLPAKLAQRAINPIDQFVLNRLSERGLVPAQPADRRTLIRRVYFDLLGLPPTPAEVQSFVQDTDPRAYERLVERLLASPQYGERWARHWLDVVHYGDTHGYDKDKLRPHAWPYRDYVVRALNADRPYTRFVHEQLAGDQLWPQSPDAIVATGFLAAGPWDFIGHAEVPETKIDGRIARHLDRDDIVKTTMNAFLGLTVQCARCHDHKFDPVRQEHYYSLQAVFAALDRADRPYEVSREVAQRKRHLQARLAATERRHEQLLGEQKSAAGPRLDQLDHQIAEIQQRAAEPRKSDAYGFHSQIMPSAEHTKWVQIDLGRPREIETLIYVGCWDSYNDIFAGFGFPPRFKIELSNDANFEAATILLDQTQEDVANPGTQPQVVSVGGAMGRFVRFTATRLAPRQNDYIFALAELAVLDSEGRNLAAGQPVSSLDSIEAAPRWSRQNLVDGEYYEARHTLQDVAWLDALQGERQQWLAEHTPDELRRRLAETRAEQRRLEEELDSLPPARLVYAGTVHHGSGAFRGTGPDGGQPREIRILQRGNIRTPGRVVGPGTVPIIPDVDWQFNLPANHHEGDRRVALAKWITRRDNPLTWRTIVNRLWLYHFGSALADSPNDLGRMGQQPTHPELLDWLSVEFRDHGQSTKRLQWLMLTSATYRQSSHGHHGNEQIDSQNRFLWRMQRRKLEAEAVRDATLQVTGLLDRTMGGPGFRDFVLEKPEHSPHYRYDKHDVTDRSSHRRSIYRFIVRSQPQPFMETFDCADPSALVDKRNETVTVQQALTLLNHRFMVFASQAFAKRLQDERQALAEQVARGFSLTLSRPPSDQELDALLGYARQYGLPSTCRLLLNLNEFAFVD